MMRANMTPDISAMTLRDFQSLPSVITGESKEVRYLGDGLAVIRFLPTVYSFTQNRCAVVPGSHEPRLRASKLFIDALKPAGIRHAYRQVTDEFVLADLVLPHPVEFDKYNMPQFVPPDLEPEEIALLPKAPPIEVIAKRYLTGTTKHGCVGMAGTKVRSSHPFYANMPLEADGALPEMLIRFDWRNPLRQQGRGDTQWRQIERGLVDYCADPLFKNAVVAYLDRVADVPLTPQLADLFIDFQKAQRTAFLTALSLETYLAEHNLVFYDLCLFIDESGEMLYGEISPDCGRFRSLDGVSYDKDLWRTGGSEGDVLKKWLELCWLLENNPASKREG